MNQCCVDPDSVRKETQLSKLRERKFKNIPDPLCSITLEETEKLGSILTKYLPNQQNKT